MVDDKRPLDLALDALVYIPVGLAVSAKDVLPALAERGREQVTNQVTAARLIGAFAVQQGQQQMSKAFSRAREQAQSRLTNLGTPTPPVASAPRPSRPPASPPPASRPVTSGPGAAELAIPGYDTLSASQVLPRLDALAPDELEAVRVYEAAHRGRKTILGRITQLQSA